MNAINIKCNSPRCSQLNASELSILKHLAKDYESGWFELGIENFYRIVDKMEGWYQFIMKGWILFTLNWSMW